MTTINQVIEELFGLTDVKYISTESVLKSGKPHKVFSFEYNGEEPQACPECGQKMYAHDSREITVTDTPMGGVPTSLTVYYSRRRCKSCKKLWQPSFDFVDAKHKLTNRAYISIAQQSLKNTFEAVAEDYNLTGATVGNIFEDFIQEKSAALQFVTPAFLGIDEINLKKIGLVTVITDLEHRTLYDMVPGRNQETLIKYFQNMPNKENVLWVCSDMYRPFEKVIGTMFPNARWVVDHFHVVMKANQALDAVRIAVQSKMPKKERIQTKKGLAYTLKTRARDMTPEEAVKIRFLRDHPQYAILATAFDLKEDFFNIYDENRMAKEWAMDAYDEWCKKIPADKLFDKFRELAQTVVNFKQQIFAYWDCPIAISNGYTECANRLIRENNTRGRGYRFETLRARTLYRKSNLQSIIENGMAYGPAIPESEPVFRFDSEEVDDWNEEDDFNEELDDCEWFLYPADDNDDTGV